SRRHYHAPFHDSAAGDELLGELLHEVSFGLVAQTAIVEKVAHPLRQCLWCKCILLDVGAVLVSLGAGLPQVLEVVGDLPPRKRESIRSDFRVFAASRGRLPASRATCLLDSSQVENPSQNS